MDATETLVLVGAAISVISSATGIILDTLRQKRESRTAYVSEKIELGQATLDKDRLDMIDMTQTAIQNIGQYSDIDQRIRESFRSEIESMAGRYEKLFQEYEQYRAICRQSKADVSEVFESIEVLVCENMENGSKKELVKLLNKARRDLDI